VTKKARGDIPHPVVPRRVSAEGSLASLGATKKRGVRGDKMDAWAYKWGLGLQNELAVEG